LGKVLFLLETF